jgi:hypothetical protein
MSALNIFRGGALQGLSISGCCRLPLFHTIFAWVFGQEQSTVIKQRNS